MYPNKKIRSVIVIIYTFYGSVIVIVELIKIRKQIKDVDYWIISVSITSTSRTGISTTRIKIILQFFSVETAINIYWKFVIMISSEKKI